MTDRRSFVAWLGSLPLVGRPRPLGAAPPIVIDATPTALYQQPDGRNNLVRVAVMGVDAPAALDALLDRLEPHRRRPHRAARGVSRSTPPEPGCGAGPAAGTSRVPLDGGVRAAADLVRREPARRRR